MTFTFTYKGSLKPNELNLVKGLVIVHLNVRSLINKVDIIRYLISDSDIDCLCLTETWLRDIISDNLIHIEGYKLWRIDREVKDKNGKVIRGGGICIYLKDKYEGELIDLPNHNQENIEMLCLRFWGHRTGTYTCTAIYRPPKGSVEAALQTLNDVVAGLDGRDRSNLIIHGDFNVNYKNTHCNWVKKLKTFENNHGLVQVIRSDTRTCVNNSTMIDLCFSNVKHLKLAGTLNINVSDHLATYMVIKKEREEKRSKKFTGRDYSGLTPDKVNDELSRTRHNIRGDNPNSKWSSMKSQFINIADKVCPKREFYSGG